jgi:hypothetical protein
MAEQSNADYLIYTNADIALMPQFYLAVKRFIEKEYEGFIINHRTIDKKFSSLDQIPMMFSEIGEKHPGCDCFVFKRDLYPKFLLGNVAIGCAFFALTLRTNISVISKRFKHFRDLHLTFHIGNNRAWQNVFAEAMHNKKELENVFARLLSPENENINDKEMLDKMRQEYLSRCVNFMRRMKAFETKGMKQ